MQVKLKREPDGGEWGRDKKPQEDREAKELRLFSRNDCSMNRAIPSPYITNPLLGLSAIFLCLIDETINRVGAEPG